ncbi:sugar-phosphatase [Jatrophihabitans sp. GAS493]|uniref:HAD-IA family hydrolase n=1 Tax=Jatrophihabitans sp. GAS493 TaxID=1907575 RepID=UPI000BB692C8|nr:HAD-IA family hydrolase [Jatrophihabitans sp. GAS493]SOD73931.1 sugar-phosphatase [Jatrophihabitans sp. GAS493]
MSEFARPASHAPTVTVDAVLFDLDGTLVDTTAAFEAGWRDVAHQLGMPFEAFAPHIHGLPSEQVLARSAPQVIGAEREQLVEQVLTRQADPQLPVSAMPGAIDALRRIPLHQWAIVTSGSRVLASASITKAGLPRPAVVVTIDDVRAGKPAPDPFLAAAEALGFAAERCLVVEDAPAGIAAGRAAGARVLALTTTHQAAQLGGADWRVTDLRSVQMLATSNGIEVTLRTPVL